jgi:hypothetical protein
MQGTIYRLRSTVAHGGASNEHDLKREMVKIKDFGLEPWDSFLQFVDSAIRESQDLVRRALLACVRIQQQSNQDNPIRWPFSSDFDHHRWNKSTRLGWQRAGGVR